LKDDWLPVRLRVPSWSGWNSAWQAAWHRFFVSLDKEPQKGEHHVQDASGPAPDAEQLIWTAVRGRPPSVFRPQRWIAPASVRFEPIRRSPEIDDAAKTHKGV